VQRVHLGLLPPESERRAPELERNSNLVLVDRSDTSNRRCRNHIQLRQRLEEKFGDVFKVVNFVGKSHSQEENIAIFQRAAVVVAPHGGALMNLLYANPGTHVVEIGYWGSSSMCFPSYYFSLAKKLGLDYWLVMGNGQYDSDIDCPIDDVVRSVVVALSGAEENENTRVEGNGKLAAGAIVVDESNADLSREWSIGTAKASNGITP
jgi:capsular polysaccharide biosynthesis protein